MIVQSGVNHFKTRNQPQRECLYAWYPEVVSDPLPNSSQHAREIYIHKGIDKSLLQDTSAADVESMTTTTNSNNTDEVFQRYQQSMAPSERIYHSPETINEALKTPWALHFEVERRPATPNLPSHSSDGSNAVGREEMPMRRLRSAPLMRTLPATSVLTIPEPQLIMPLIPPTTTCATPVVSAAAPRVRASSAKARLNTTLPANLEQIDESTRRTIKSAMGVRVREETKPIDVETQRINASKFEQQPQQQQLLDVSSISIASAPVISHPSNEPKLFRPYVETTSLPPNLYHKYRPGVIAANNNEKKPVIRTDSASRKALRHHHHHHHHHHHRRSTHSATRQGPLLALTPVPQTKRSPVQLNGITLIYDPSLTLDDPSGRLTKYFIDGNLYLIKDQRYNVIENVEPTAVEKYQQSHSLPQRPKYYQTIPVEKFEIPKPASDLHYNASETYFYNTIPKRVHRYVIDPNFISEHLNVNKISLSQRPSTAGSAAAEQIHRSSMRTRPVYA